MPIPAAAIPAIIGGVTAIGNAIGGAGQNKKNRQAQTQQNSLDRQHQMAMYNLQRAHSLEDYNMQNAYNHPLQMMKRYEEAGLNPNLIYEKGAGATAAQVKNTTAPLDKQDAPMHRNSPLQTLSTGMLQAYNGYAQVKNLNAQTDNLQAQNEVIKRDALLKDANIANTLANTDRTKFETLKSKELKDLIIEKAKAEVLGSQIDNKIKLSTEERNAITHANSVKQAVQNYYKIQLQNAKTKEEIRNIKSTINSRDVNTAIKQEELKLRKMGLNPSDPAYVKAIVELLYAFRNGDLKMPDINLNPFK